MKKVLLLLCLLVSIGSFDAVAAKKMTINVIPEFANIYVDGQLVGTGSYQVKFDRNTDFFFNKGGGA